MSSNIAETDNKCCNMELRLVDVEKENRELKQNVKKSEEKIRELEQKLEKHIKENEELNLT